MHLIIFDCSKESHFNHAFHERCLRSYLEEEWRKDKKASQQKFDLNKLARCIVCYKNNQDIQPETSRQSTRHQGRHQRHSRIPSIQLQQNSSEASSDTHSHSSSSQQQ